MSCPALKYYDRVRSTSLGIGRPEAFVGGKGDDRGEAGKMNVVID